MRKSVGKNLISLLFLSAFLFLRVADTHAFSHFSDDEADTDCELCEIIIATQQLTPFLNQPADDADDNAIVFPESTITNQSYEEPRHLIVSPLTVYNKPPPLL